MAFAEALEFAYKQKQMEPHTKEDVASVLRYVKQAITAEGMNGLMISQVERKHVKMLLDRCGQIKTTWTNNTFNQYRKYLNILFGELMQYDAIQNNPIMGIKKMKSLIKTRTVLSTDERKKVSHSLKTNHYSFWRFLQIFFHSGARITELVAVRVSQVDLKKQTFKVIVKKGKEQREVVKPIKNVALLYWKELVQDAPDHSFVFGEGLVPELRDKPIRPEQITRRWKRHVKIKLGIQADFYSLKHLNTDETAALLGIEAAAAQNSHTTTVITMKHYAIGEKARQMERLKKVGNTFA
jgi:site-specific recombinase XerC